MIEVPTLDGPDHLDVPRGTQSGDVLRIKGRGMPDIGGRGRGDELVEVVVETPRHSDRPAGRAAPRVRRDRARAGQPATQELLRETARLFHRGGRARTDSSRSLERIAAVPVDRAGGPRPKCRSYEHESTESRPGTPRDLGAEIPQIEPIAPPAGAGGGRGSARVTVRRCRRPTRSPVEARARRVSRSGSCGRAEFANYQKRAKQQADADRVYAVGSLAHDLLDPLDNLERAIDALRASGADGSHRRARHGSEATARDPGQARRRADRAHWASRSTPTCTRPSSSSPRANIPRGPSSPS